jgi:coiled-coil domain-containing protein 77
MIEDIKQLAAVDPQNYGGLLAFYREKIRLMENERIDSISQFETLKGDQKERHQMEWENFRLKNELKELHITLSESKLSFFEEKTLLIKLQNENENLSENLNAEKIKVKQFLEFFRPTEQKIIMKEMEKPKVEYKFVKNDLNIENSLNKKTNKANHQTTNLLFKKSLVIKGSNSSEKCLNVQNFDSSSPPNVNQLTKIRQLETENEILSMRIEALYSETLKQKEVYNSKIADFEDEIKRLSDKTNKLERINLEINKQYFEQKLFFSETENKLNEELELQKLKTLNLTIKLQEEQKGNEIDHAYSQRLIESKVNESIKSLKSQLSEKEESLTIIKEQYAQVQRIFKEKLKNLEESNKKLNDRVKLAERSRGMDEEGYLIDIKNLKEKNEELKEQIIYLSKENNGDGNVEYSNKQTIDGGKSKSRTDFKSQKRNNSMKREVKNAVAQIQSHY